MFKKRMFEYTGDTSRNMCDTCESNYPECKGGTSGDLVFGCEIKGMPESADNIYLCLDFKEKSND